MQDLSEFKRISILVDKELHQKVKMDALKVGLRMKEYILQCIQRQSQMMAHSK